MLKPFLLGDGRRLLICETTADSDLWVVFLPGSSADIWNFGWAENRALLGAYAGRANVLVINKPGMGVDGRVREREFERSYRREIRIKDYSEVLRRVIPATARIFMVGFSEGAYLSPEVALRDRRIRALTLISGGTRSWLDEEIYKASPSSLTKTIRRVAQVYARPNSLGGHWHGLSNATWRSYDNDNTLRALERLHIPVLALHGTQDGMIDVASAREDLLRLKSEGKDISLRLFEGVDHTLGRYWMKALRAAGGFLKKTMHAPVQCPTKAPSSRVVVDQHDPLRVTADL